MVFLVLIYNLSRICRLQHTSDFQVQDTSHVEVSKPPEWWPMWICPALSLRNFVKVPCRLHMFSIPMARRDHPSLKKSSENSGWNFGVQPIPRIAPRVAPRIGFSHKSGRECNSESYSENIPEFRDSENGLFTPRAFLFQIGGSQASDYGSEHLTETSRALFQSRAPALDQISGPMGARYLSSTGLGFSTLIGRAQLLPAPALDKYRSPMIASTAWPKCLHYSNYSSWN